MGVDDLSTYLPAYNFGLGPHDITTSLSPPSLLRFLPAPDLLALCSLSRPGWQRSQKPWVTPASSPRRTLPPPHLSAAGSLESASCILTTPCSCTPACLGLPRCYTKALRGTTGSLPCLSCYQPCARARFLAQSSQGQSKQVAGATVPRAASPHQASSLCFKSTYPGPTTAF